MKLCYFHSCIVSVSCLDLNVLGFLDLCCVVIKACKDDQCISDLKQIEGRNSKAIES